MVVKFQKKGVVIFLVCIFINAGSYSKDYSDIYDQQELRAASKLYSENLKYTWRDDFLSRLTLKERSMAPAVQLRLPLIGAHKSPFDYYADSSQQIVTIPIMSVKFLDELSIAQAYLEQFNCDKDALFDYVVLLGRKNDFQHISPLRALGIPSNALDNSFVNKTSGNALKSAVYYIMAHEYAHVMYKHQGYDQITANKAQAQEIEADNFALKIMNRIGVAPLGMVGYFALLSLYDSVPSDFKNLREYEVYLKYSSTHPLSSDRLMNIANTLKSDPAGFARSEKDPYSWTSRILSAAHDIEIIGTNLDDSKLREYQINKAFKLTMDNLVSACH